MTRKPKGYWTFENCSKEALKYKSKTEFRNNSSGAYSIAEKNKWLGGICGHMEEIRKPSGYWTFENCKTEALKYEVRADFHKGSIGAYTAAYKNKWLDMICSHMKILGNIYSRCVYVIRNEDLNKAYIGITSNFERRVNQHKSNNNTCSSKSISRLKDTIYEQITDYIYSKEEVKEVEYKFALLYKNKGYAILNNSKSYGALGYSGLIWTKEKCKEEALKYKNRTEFFKGSSGAYDSAYRRNWLDDICKHMVARKKKDNYWTFERCANEALNYKTRLDFRNKSASAYRTACKNKWLNRICNHMIEIKKPNGYWNFEKCKREAAKYLNKTEFLKKATSAYNSSRRNNWLEIFYS